MKKPVLLRWIVCALLLCALAFTVSSPALADVYPLPLDQKVGGNEPQADGWYGEGTKKSAYENYSDPSIQVTTEHLKANGVSCCIVRVLIADPTQLRTAMSYDSYDKDSSVVAKKMAAAKNAICAVNGDFFKYHYKVGYVVRQGQFYRDALNGKRDLLLIDDRGDFWGIRLATSEMVQTFLADELPEGRQIVNTFTLGPILVKDGEVLEVDTDEFQAHQRMQRVCIVQVSEREYAIVECDGRADGSSGMALSTFASFVQEQFPTCRMAYNLDGGGSTNVIVHDMRIHKNNDARAISDIIYFASAYTAD